MGLDNFWDLPANVHLEFNPPLALCGGLYSRHGQGSFRGKVYRSFFREELDVDLHEDMTNEEVRAVARLLADVEWRQEFENERYYPSSEDVLEDLTRMFDAYGQAGASLHAWY